MPSVSIVLPCYMPPAGWAGNIARNHKELEELLATKVEVILVRVGNNQYIKDADVQFLRNKIHNLQFVAYEQNRGKGFAIREGVRKASGEIIIYTDIDLPYDNQSIARIYEVLKTNSAEIAIGVKDENYYKQVVRSRRVISRVLRWLTKFFLSVPITDTQCGLKGFRKDIRQIFLATTINRYLFDLEFIRNSARLGRKLEAVPVTLNHDIRINRINYRILLPELYNFLKVLLSRQ